MSSASSYASEKPRIRLPHDVYNTQNLPVLTVSFLDIYTIDSEVRGLRTGHKKNSLFLITKKAILPISKAKEEKSRV